ncbi:hypothetical protein HDF19_12710 [Mucilaginibacter sp. E4BP6]|uniref:hypothetical protein n=1 Tax=Mucilaginibacter sp. E4BP6 TaxID=2723089 RepID=UPI0015C9EFC6|nr:hypothetical protein [Mucilaginibacter sp. E4BP6]NYE64972.1 hypothetical protein [Mucilaginibacter sp. E4BP6]
MKMVIGKFKNNPGVKFLFIDTQEKPNVSKVKAIMADNDTNSILHLISLIQTAQRA